MRAFRNADFEACFGGDDGEFGAGAHDSALPPAPALALERSESIGNIVNISTACNRSSIQLLSASANDLFEEDDVYRSVGALTMGHSHSVPLMEGCKDLCMDHSAFSPFAKSAGSNKVDSGARPQRMLNCVEHSILAPIHAFSDEQDGSKVLERVVSALSQCGVLSRPFSQQSSSFACRMGSTDFDLYVFELRAEDKSAKLGQFVIEIQRTSSGFCFQEWGTLVQNFMESIGDICTSEGYFRRCAAKVEDFDTDTLVFFDNTEAEGETSSPVDSPDLEHEYQKLVHMLCDKDTAFETKLELSQLLAKLSTKREGAEIMLRIKGLEALTAALQVELLKGSSTGTYNCSLCSILGNLAAYNTCSKTGQEAAFTAATVMRGASDDELEVEQLRQAARALAGYCKHLHRKTELKALIRESIEHRRQNCSDKEVEKYSIQALQHLQAC